MRMGGSMRGFRFRFYPKLKQRRNLARAFGTTRHVFNWGLATKRDAYAQRQEFIGDVELSRRLTAYKTERPGLSKVNRDLLTQALRDLDTAYQNFFKKRARFPRFKSRHGPQSVRFRFDHRHAGKVSAWAKRILVLPGIGECGIADSRKNFTHKVSAHIASSANVVVMETLNVAGMVKNHTLARSLSDAAMSELHRQINYKVARRGGTVIRVDRWAPTSKVCSGCGHRRDEMPLSVRSWTCAECGSEHDRDVNAAKNVLALGRGTASMRGDERGSGGAQAPPVLSVEPRISAAAQRRSNRQRAA